MRRARGFTLIELLVYLALLVAGTLTIAGLEFTASRAAFLERALVDLGLESGELGARFRDDVAQAVKIEQPGGALLVLTMPSGGEVRWDLQGGSVERAGPVTRASGAKLVRLVYPKPGGQPSRIQPFPYLEKLSCTRSGQLLRFDVTLAAARGDEITARRSYQFSAAPVAEDVP